MSQPIRFAAIGVSGIAGSHFDAVLKRPDVEVVGLCDVVPDSLERAGKRFSDAIASRDYKEMLAKAKPGLVAVCTPNKYHCEQTLAVLAAGAHAICEKPMAMTLAEAKKMEAAREKAGKLGYINFSYRNVPAFRFARQLIANGELGNIIRVHALYLQSWLGAPDTQFSWRNDADVAGYGALGDLGVHMIDAVRFISGLNYERVIGLARVLIPEKLDGAGKPHKVTTDTCANFLSEMTGGVIASFETSQAAPGYGNFHCIEVSGTKGTLIVESDRGDELRMAVGDTLTRDGTWRTDIPTHAVPTSFKAKQKADGPALIVDAIRGEKVDYPKFADGVAAQGVLEAIGASMKTNAWVVL